MPHAWPTRDGPRISNAPASVLFQAIVFGESNGYGWSAGTITHRVRIAKNPETSAEKGRPELADAAVTYSCSGSCDPGGRLMTDAELAFQAPTQIVLGIGLITLNASATVTIE